MTSEMIIKSQNGDSEIVFTDFEFDFDQVFKQISFKVTVKCELFIATTNIYAELYDFETMLYLLKEMYVLRVKDFVFNPIDKKIIIKLSLTETGVIIVSLKLDNDMFSSSVELEFKTDLTFLPELISDLETILSSSQ